MTKKKPVLPVPPEIAAINRLSDEGASSYSKMNRRLQWLQREWQAPALSGDWPQHDRAIAGLRRHTGSTRIGCSAAI
jgi:hypothetical protein